MILNQFRNKSLSTNKNTQPSIKQEVRNFYGGNPISCRINHVLISYLIYKQVRINTFKSVLMCFMVKGASLYGTVSLSQVGSPDLSFILVFLFIGMEQV